MRFLGYTLASEAETPTEPPSPDLYEKMGRFVEEAVKAGVIVATGGIAPTSEGVRISLKNDEYTVVDGPFVEARLDLQLTPDLRVLDRQTALAAKAVDRLALAHGGEPCTGVLRGAVAGPLAEGV